MANGPFESYAPPGVYTRTQVERDTSGPPTGNRIPVLVGVGRETLSQSELELVRGSSGSVDQRIVDEDVNERFILDDSNPSNPVLGSKDGEVAKFQVQNYPLVTGNGRGAVTNDPQQVTVTVDGALVQPAAVDGSRGVITLQVAPAEDAEVRATYFFNRTDTQAEDDLSGQVTDEKALLLGAITGPYEIVAGTNDVLSLEVDGDSVTVDLTAGAVRTAANIVSDITAAAIVGLTASVDTDNQGNDRVQLEADASLAILSGSANSTLGFLAGQKSNRNRVFHTFQSPLVTGDNGGVITTDPADVTVFVDGTQVVPSEVDGTNGSVTLAQAPAVGAKVVVRYYYNTWQDTFDHLPNTGIRRVHRVGISPGRTDYIEGQDYVVDSNGRILWGSAATVESGQHTGGAEFFDDTQISTTLVDNRMYFEEVERFVNRSTTPAQVSNNTVVLSNMPTIGNGRSTTLDSDLYGSLSSNRAGVLTHRPELVKVYHGVTEVDAQAAGPVEVVDVDPATRKVTVAEEIPANHKVWATYWYNRLQDDTLTFSVLSASTATSAGQYEVNSSLLGESLYDVRFGTKSNTSFTVQWPSGVESSPDAFVTGTDGVDETVTVTFTSLAAQAAVFVNSEVGPYDLYSGASDTLDLDVDGNSMSITLSGDAINQPAELTGDALVEAGLDSLDAATTADFEVSVNGVEFTVDLTGVTFVDTSVTTDCATTLAAAIDTVITAEGAATANGSQLVITSNDDGPNSSVEILDGNANEWVGFEEGDAASQHRPDAADIAAGLNADGTFGPAATADTVTVAGEGTYLRITSDTTGSSSTLAFTGGNALNDTGLGIEAGDGATGTDASDGFNVTSSRNDGLGSSGSGVVGQTYTDDQTGLRFTVLEPTTGDYPDAESFTLDVTDTFTTGNAVVVRSVPGLEVTVDNTTDVGVGDTALVKTYNKSGEEPGIGDFYYITYEYEKSDFSTRLFTRFRDIQRNYGELSPNNPLTMASYLAILNGAVIVGCKQVLKEPGFNQATSQSYLDALEELGKPLTAGNTPDLLVPLTSDPDVMGAYVRHSEIQSSQRFRQERRCIFGVSSGTRPEEAKEIAEGLGSSRAILAYPDSAIVSLTNEAGQEESFIVDGTYIAAALAGVLVSPQFDVATPLTRRRLTGFRRLNRAMDSVEMNQLAVSGVTVLEDKGTFLQVRDGLTTDVSTRFTSTPSIVAIQDHVEQQSRNSLDRFIGLKHITSRAQDVELALTGLLNSLKEQQIIADFKGVRAEPDPDDPTTLRVTAFYAPIFPLKYIPIMYQIGSTSSL